MPKRDRFIEGLRRKQQTAARSAAPPAKAPAEMSDAELAAEAARLEREIRTTNERMVEAGRQELAGGGGGQLGRAWIPRRPKKRSWK